MTFLIIGLGSMGKRRTRCLQSLGFDDIIGFDLRTDRLLEVEKLYGIQTVDSLSKIDITKINAILICTPPDFHTPYIKLSIDSNIPCFVEASVIIEDVQDVINYNSKNIFVAPSCTLRFHPIISEITRIIKSRKYGKITNFTYHSGQYLPDWHPWENVKDFYVGKRETGGGREIVPFELTWIIDSIGWPDEVKGVFSKTIDFGANIEDTYAFLLKYKDKVGSITVDVASRYAVRNLVINFETAQIQWRWDDGYFRIFESDSNQWITINQPESTAAAGYNKNIGEDMYVEELKSFITGISNPNLYPNNLNDDLKILKILDEIEKSDGGF